MAREPAANFPNLYLIGFMGVGKSAVGRSVARQLGMRFLDSDWSIEQKEGKAITEIFATSGEAAFRKMERDFIESGHPERGVVVACGGGLPLQEGMPELLLQKGVVVCLFAHPKTILARTSGNQKRPLLNVDNPSEKIQKLLAEREPSYMKIGIGISAEGRQISDVVNNVVRVYHRDCNRFPSQ
jgi:shikimate kinase